MTRINVGIEPFELCDQHLSAEYKELPRIWPTRENGGPKLFTLGTGHVLWCARYKGSLAERYQKIVEELIYRGFNVKYPLAPEINFNKPKWTDDDTKLARPILINRILDRLNNMKRQPVWTRREYANFKN